MEPIGKIYKEDGEEVLVHKCLKCGQIRKNRIAGDDSVKGVAALKVVNFEKLSKENADLLQAV